jgi:ATP-dependent DNA helicase RecG
VANATSQKAHYIKMRSFDDYHYEEMIVGYLREFGQASRKELDELLRAKLSEALDETQKTHKIGNLLSALRRKGRIRNFGSTASPKWQLTE